MKEKKLIPVDNFVKDIARQPNEFTSAIFRGTAMAYRIVIFALFKTVITKNHLSPETKNRYCVFSQNEFCEKLGIPSGSKTTQIIEKATNELAQSFIVLRNENAKNDSDVYTAKILWFQKIEILKNGDIALTFNEEIAKHFEFKIGYTALELLEIGSLQSFYAMRYYGLAKSRAGWSGKDGNSTNEWWFEYTEDELRQLFGVDKDKYKDRRKFVEKVIKQPCDEVCRKTTLNISLSYEKICKGKYRWHFSCSPKTEMRFDIKASDSIAVQREKREINSQFAEIEAYKQKYPELFEKALEFVKSKNKLPFSFSVNNEFDAMNMLKSQNFTV